MTPTHTRAEVEQLAARLEDCAAQLRFCALANIKAHELDDSALALRQLAASIGAEPVAGDPGWLKTELDSIGPETERWSDGLKESFNSHIPGTFDLPSASPISAAEHAAVVAELEAAKRWMLPETTAAAVSQSATLVEANMQLVRDLAEARHDAVAAIARAETAEAALSKALEALKPFAAASEEADRLLVEAQRSLHPDADGISDGELAELVSPSSSIRMAGVTPTSRAVITTGDLRRAAIALIPAPSGEGEVR